MRKISVTWIIHIFAVLHAIVTIICRWASIEDELLLTLLTMTMILLLCLKRHLNIELTASSIIISNILGYILGNAGASLFALMLKSPYLIHALASIFTTEILGWSIVVFTTYFFRKPKDQDPSSHSYLIWLLSGIIGIFVLRLTIMLILSSDYFASVDLSRMTSEILSNVLALIILICTNTLYIWSARRLLKHSHRVMQFLALITFTLLASLLETILVSIGLPAGSELSSPQDFVRLYMAALITQIAIYCLVYMTNYALFARSKMQEARGKANVAQYRYQILKRQVNPHFLFNSLNALDCLVCEQKTEQASTYIHKLAGVYRYMIKSEDESLVSLEEELKFVEMYVDLMKVRFPAGLEVIVNVPQELSRHLVLTCALQLLIENAVKHNVINASNPLIVRIEADSAHIRVSNNVIPKLTQVNSTGLGQKYIMKQYLDICGKAIVISHTDKEYSVVLPLI